MHQQSLSNSGFDKYSKKTRKQRFLEAGLPDEARWNYERLVTQIDELRLP